VGWRFVLTSTGIGKRPSSAWLGGKLGIPGYSKRKRQPKLKQYPSKVSLSCLKPVQMDAFGCKVSQMMQMMQSDALCCK
jgi:hypothetical protein